MKRALAVVLIAAFVLAGCVANAATLIKRIQDLTIEACGYLPAADFVNELLGKPWPTGDKVLIIAGEICNKVKPPGTEARMAVAAQAEGPLTIQGVLVRGEFVRVVNP